MLDHRSPTLAACAICDTVHSLCALTQEHALIGVTHLWHLDLEEIDTSGAKNKCKRREIDSLFILSHVIYWWHRHFKSCMNTDLPTHSFFTEHNSGRNSSGMQHKPISHLISTEYYVFHQCFIKRMIHAVDPIYPKISLSLFTAQYLFSRFKTSWTTNCESSVVNYLAE